MRCLITGIAGFAGRHLAELLLGRGDAVHGTLHRSASEPRMGNLVARHPDLSARLHVADIGDAEAIARVMAAVQPQALYHLAGMTFVPNSMADPAAAMRVN